MPQFHLPEEIEEKLTPPEIRALEAELKDQMRRRQAEFIHDEVSGALSAILQISEAAKNDASLIPEIQSLAGEAQDSIRMLSDGLQPVSRLSFTEGIQHVQSLAELYDSTIEVIATGDSSLLHEKLQNDVLRTLRELVRNACEHGTPPVEAEVAIGPKQTAIKVSDYGPGFELSAEDLWYVRARAEEHDGTVSVADNLKTTVQVDFKT